MSLAKGNGCSSRDLALKGLLVWLSPSLVGQRWPETAPPRSGGPHPLIREHALQRAGCMQMAQEVPGHSNTTRLLLEVPSEGTKPQLH